LLPKNNAGRTQFSRNFSRNGKMIPLVPE